jgi:hypothetical protein
MKVKHGCNILDLGQRVEDAVIVDGVFFAVDKQNKLILMKVLKVSLLRTHLFR